MINCTNLSSTSALHRSTSYKNGRFSQATLGLHNPVNQFTVIVLYCYCIAWLLHGYCTVTVLCRYKIYARYGCPKAYQPFHLALCTPSRAQFVSDTPADILGWSISDLEPYTSYQWKVEAVNEAGVTTTNTWSEPENTGSLGRLG